MMNGLLESNEGSIYIDGQLLTEETVYEARRKVGMVFQIQTINLLVLL